MKGSNAIVLFFFLLCQSLWSQNNIHFISSAARLKNKEKLTRTERYLSTLDPDTPIEGSMYLDNEFAPTVIVFENGQINDQLLFRYNAFYDEMEYLGPKGDTLVLEDLTEIKCLTLGNRKFIYHTTMNNTRKEEGFLEVIADGDTRLLCRHKMIFERADPPYTLLHHGHTFDRFRHQKLFYLQTESRPAIRITLSRSGLMKVLPEKQEKIERLWKTLKPNNNILSEIKSFFKHLNMT